jgi:hypothetical protein
MFRTFRHSCFALPLLIGAFAAPLYAQTPPAPVTPVAPEPPVAPVETPDFPGAVWAPASPDNFKPSNRPSAEQAIDRIVIHDIEGPALSAVRWFQNPKAQASSHYVIDSQTGLVYQQVKERDVAWHAGDRTTNARSVGIEHGGYAYRPGFFTATEYESSAKLVRHISARYGIPRDREHIIAHAEVPDSANPGKFGGRGGHTDPGPYWDWDYFMTLVRNTATLSAGAPGAPPALPIILHPGETKPATVIPANPVPEAIPVSLPLTLMLTNAGDDVWLANRKDKPETERRKIGTVFLGTASGQNSVLAAADWVSPRYVGSSADGDIAPGSAGNFPVSLRAPANFLGSITETFRLVHVPTAPRQPVPFGDAVSISVRVEPWDITVPLPNTPPAGWNTKTSPDGSRVFWRRSVPSSQSSAATSPAPPEPVRWETRLPIAGEWDVYVRYPAAGDRVTGATYETSASGAQSKKLNQKQGGNAWRKLGRYAFNPSTPPPVAGTTFSSASPATGPVTGAVSLTATTSGPGTLVAGDVRFVGPFPAKQNPPK